MKLISLRAEFELINFDLHGRRIREGRIQEDLTLTANSSGLIVTPHYLGVVDKINPDGSKQLMPDGTVDFHRIVTSKFEGSEAEQISEVKIVDQAIFTRLPLNTNIYDLNSVADALSEKFQKNDYFKDVNLVTELWLGTGNKISNGHPVIVRGYFYQVMPH